MLDICVPYSAVTKPAVGFFDLASNLSEGMQRLPDSDAGHSSTHNVTLRKVFVIPPLYLIALNGNA